MRRTPAHAWRRRESTRVSKRSCVVARWRQTVEIEGRPARTDAITSSTSGSAARYVNSATATGGAATTAPTRWVCGDCVDSSALKSAPAKRLPDTTEPMRRVSAPKARAPLLSPLDTWPSSDEPPLLPPPPAAAASSSSRASRRRRCSPSRKRTAPTSSAESAWATSKRVTMRVASPTATVPWRKSRRTAAVSGRPRTSVGGMRFADGKMTASTSQSTMPQVAVLAA